MRQAGMQPNSVTFAGVLNACASGVALEEGRSFHYQIIQSGLELDVLVGSSLVDIYAKCGSIQDSWRVFNKMPSQNVATWNAILGGCAEHVHAKEALKHSEQTSEEGSHAGLVDEDMRLYASMIKDYTIAAELEQYTCMVDLLGRAGNLQDTEKMIKSMPFKPDVATWMGLLGACRTHGNGDGKTCC
ncbi:unnamed protein product [Sphagnum balticum]